MEGGEKGGDISIGKTKRLNFVAVARILVHKTQFFPQISL